MVDGGRLSDTCYTSLAQASVCVVQGMWPILVLQGCQTPDLMCAVWDYLEKAGLPYFTRARSPGLTVNIQNPLLAPEEPGIQTASRTVLVTLATHLSLERWPVQIGLQEQASGPESVPHKELALACLIWGSQPPKFLGQFS